MRLAFRGRTGKQKESDERETEGDCDGKCKIKDHKNSQGPPAPEWEFSRVSPPEVPSDVYFS